MGFCKNIIVKMFAIIGLLFSFSSFATTVQFETNMGNFEVELFDDIAPKSVANFLDYVNAGAYDDSIIHRSVENFIIQGGGFQYKGELPLPAIPANDPVVNEPNESNLRGTIAYAKVSGQPDSATTGWFINLEDNSENLDNQNSGFTVFGKVIGDGMTVIDAIAAVPVYDGGGAFTNLPLQNFTSGDTPNDTNFVIITSARVIDENIVTEPKKSSGGGSLNPLLLLLLLGFIFPSLRKIHTSSKRNYK